MRKSINVFKGVVLEYLSIPLKHKSLILQIKKIIIVIISFFVTFPAPLARPLPLPLKFSGYATEKESFEIFMLNTNS